MKKFIFRIVYILILIPLWIFLRSVYRDRIGAFGCFDDCFNYMGGYFLLSGKRLFSEIFFNHMPILAHISAAIQQTTNPESIYMLIYEHRMVLVYFFIIADVLLILRFGLAGFGFAVLYESTKGFLFGERFLAESLIVYPLVYLFGLAWRLLCKKNISTLEVWISAGLTWFVVFSREPYVPLAVWLFGTIAWFYRKRLWALWSIGIFILSSAITILYYGINAFIFNVFTVNKLSIATGTSVTAQQAGGFASIILYPFQLFGPGTWNLFRQIEISLVVLLAVSLFVLKRSLPIYKTIVFLFITFTLANIRPVIPGAVYYGAFHHIVWYGLLAFTTALFVTQGVLLTKIAFTGIILYGLLSPQSYLYENVDRQTEFTTNFSHYYVVGEVVRRLSAQNDTLFLDQWDDLIYWQAKRLSPYRYSWYTSLMPYFPVYTKAREEMFKINPPTFYYGKCADLGSLSTGEDILQGSHDFETDVDYVRLTQNSKLSCLWVRSDKLSTVSSDQWQSVKQFQYDPVYGEN